MQPTKEDCAKYIEGQPGAIAYFGKDKIDAWAAGQEVSGEFDTLYNWYVMGNYQDINSWIANHCQGVTAPADTGFSDSSKVEDINAAIDFFNKDLAYEQNALTTEQGQETPDKTALQTIGQNIGVLRRAIAYYQGLLVQAQQQEKSTD